MTDIAKLPHRRLVASLRSARSALANLREAAERGLERSIVGGAAVGGGALNGYVRGWCEKNGKDITIGDSEIPWSVPIGAVAIMGGAFGEKILGDALANAMLGLGAGSVAFDVGMMSYKAGLKP